MVDFALTLARFYIMSVLYYEGISHGNLSTLAYLND